MHHFSKCALVLDFLFPFSVIFQCDQPYQFYINHTYEEMFNLPNSILFYWVENRLGKQTRAHINLSISFVCLFVFVQHLLGIDNRLVTLSTGDDSQGTERTC